MSVYRVPKGVLHELETIRRNFFNGSDSNNKKASWIRWSFVLTAKEKGGLGVASLFALNRSLMLKWIWRFFTQNNSLWANVVKAIHGKDRGIRKACNPGARSCWLNIIKEAQNLKEHGTGFFEYVKLNLGDGSSFLFWEECWSKDRILKDVFPRSYALETRKSITVKDKLSDPSLDFSFRRHTKGGVETMQYNTLSDMISDVSLVPQNDMYVWSLDNSGSYFVPSMRKVIDDKRTSSVSTMTRWVKCLPIKVNVFAWKVKMNAIPTRFNLSLCGIEIGSLKCPICDQGIETSCHLFFNYSLARQLTAKLIQWWNISYDNVNSYDKWILWLNSFRMSSNLKAMLQKCVLCYVVVHMVVSKQDSLRLQKSFKDDIV